jgi:hypothetical protein
MPCRIVVVVVDGSVSGTRGASRGCVVGGVLITGAESPRRKNPGGNVDTVVLAGVVVVVAPLLHGDTAGAPPVAGEVLAHGGCDVGVV